MNFFKNKAERDIPRSIESASSGGNGYPENYAVSSLRERRLLLSLRIVSIALVFSITIAVVLTFLLMSLFPLKEVRPFLVQVADEGSIAASVKPIQDTFDAKDILTEKLVREYVVNRNEILRSDAVMQDRWAENSYLGTTTDPREYSRFVERVSDQLDDIRRLDGQIRVEVISVSAVRTGQVYVIDYRAISYNGRDEVVDDRVYTATMEISFRKITGLTRGQMLINPTGFTVLSHTIAEKNQ
jgi:type IV secretory pathway component VirB8